MLVVDSAYPARWIFMHRQTVALSGFSRRCRIKEKKI
jgi:hypothetical protein